MFIWWYPGIEKEKEKIYPINTISENALKAKEKIRDMVNNFIEDGKYSSSEYTLIKRYIGQYAKITNNKDLKFCKIQSRRLLDLLLEHKQGKKQTGFPWNE